MFIADHISDHNELVERRQGRICIRNLENAYGVVYYTTAKAAVPGSPLAQTISRVYVLTSSHIVVVFAC